MGEQEFREGYKVVSRVDGDTGSVWQLDGRHEGREIPEDCVLVGWDQGVATITEMSDLEVV